MKILSRIRNRKEKVIKLIYDLNKSLDSSFDKRCYNIKEASDLLEVEIRKLLIDKALLEKKTEKQAALIKRMLENDDVGVVFNGELYDITRAELDVHINPEKAGEDLCSFLTVHCKKNELASQLMDEAKTNLEGTVLTEM